ncbi:MAG: phenylalanine--tRNA ligase subunit beta [Candidatus Methanoplasma sp.]|jgi:phenylalanyl-tRNA synthetase beta chain|nr:phenylalanine--tRNA ligase subunit beta [Candidatus Methanoplasma sp.]
MPVINFSYRDLCSLMGADVPREELVERIPLIGADMHDEGDGSDEMSVEFFPDRPDLFSVEGLARALRAFLSIEPGLREYPVGPPLLEVSVDPGVKGVRPFFACAAVVGVGIDDALLRSMMELQEKLHLTIGRKRAKLAIGIHDMDAVAPPFRYGVADPDGASFAPLGHREPMTLRGILSGHDKGREYAHLLDGFSEYPLITDAEGRVLSFPPIINGALTAVTTNTRNVFIDVTGTDGKAVDGALNIVASALAERGGEIRSVRVTGEGGRVSPDLSASERRVSASECGRFLGVPASPRDLADALRRMGMGAEADGDSIAVRIPATRLDVMHDVDVFEDAAIGYGFERFGSRHPVAQTVGRLLPETAFSEKMRDVMIGLGFTEVSALTLSNERDEFERSGLPETGVVRLLNPVTEDHTCLRPYLMPGLMRILRHNKHRDLPQRIFEIGYAVRGGKASLRLCALSASSKAPFSEIKSISESVLREAGAEFSLSPSDAAAFVPGRGASVASGGMEIGFFGEVSPEVVTSFDLSHPVSMFEADLSRIAAEKSGSLF